VALYRDTIRLLLQFAQKELGKSPSKLEMTDLNTTLIGAFLDNLEKARANSSRSRNLRLTAIRSFFRYTATECPEHSAGIQHVLAIPPKRQTSRLVDFLMRPEIEALVAAPDQATWLGRRDRGLLLFAIQTGLRISEGRTQDGRSEGGRPLPTFHTANIIARAACPFGQPAVAALVTKFASRPSAFYLKFGVQINRRTGCLARRDPHMARHDQFTIHERKFSLSANPAGQVAYSSKIQPGVRPRIESHHVRKSAPP
jgi:hypothetical protein